MMNNATPAIVALILLATNGLEGIRPPEDQEEIIIGHIEPAPDPLTALYEQQRRENEAETARQLEAYNQISLDQLAQASDFIHEQHTNQPCTKTTTAIGG